MLLPSFMSTLVSLNFSKMGVRYVIWMILTTPHNICLTPIQNTGNSGVELSRFFLLVDHRKTPLGVGAHCTPPPESRDTVLVCLAQ